MLQVMPSTAGLARAMAFVQRAALATALCVAAAGAQAADAIFLKLDGIRGDSSDARHRDEIELSSYAQAFRNNAHGHGGGSGVGHVRCGDITVLKNIDRASPDLIMHVTTGRHIREGTITFTRRDGGAQGGIDYYIVRLREVFIEAVEQIDPPGDGGLREKLSLKARVFQFTYYPIDARGGLGAPVTFGWDCVSNQRL